MKQFIVGMIVGTVITGSGALALNNTADNPIKHLPVQTQLDRLVDACGASFMEIGENLSMLQMAIMDLDTRVKALEKRNGV